MMKNNSLKFILENKYFQYSILFVIAIITWQIFYPGLMSPDSLAQYDQGRSGNYVDWHPPMMAIVLRFVVKLGGDIGILILIQCLAALFGLRCILINLFRFFSKDFSIEPFSRFVATIITIIFLIPFLSPYLLFSVMFWTDAWLSIVLLWVVSYILWIYFNQKDLTQKQFIIHIILFSLSAGLMFLIRHNSMVMIPPISLILAFVASQKLGKKGIISIVLPLFFAFIINTCIYTFFNVSKTYAGNQVIASDFTIMLKLYPEIGEKYPIANRHKESPTVLLTDNGGMWNDTTEGKPCPVLNKKICDPKMPLSCFGFKENTFGVDGNDCYSRIGTDNKALKDEYMRAIFNNPIELAAAKIYLFGQILHSDNWRNNRIVCEISKNNSGLELNNNFTQIRTNLCYLNDQFANNWYFYWIFGVHPLWLIINFLFFLYFVVIFAIKRESRIFIALLLFSIPLSYYLSYLLAATTQDYRFMYPSTLMMQILVITFVFSRLSIFNNQNLENKE